MFTRFTLGSFVVLVGVSAAPHVQAHFKLLSPASWLKEDAVGGPQKGSPCGPGNSGLLGDDVQPVPTSGAITEVHAGDVVSVDIQETIYHPGYFRIALAENRDDFTIPPVDDPTSCAFDVNAVPTGAHDNVLMDGLFKETSAAGQTRHLMQDVTLPDKPCEKCTLQIVQVMLNHGLSSCYYYHCADLKILPKADAAGGSGAAGAAGMTSAGASGAAGAAGMPGGGGGTGAAGMGAAAGASRTAGIGAAGSMAGASGMAVTAATAGVSGATAGGSSGAAGVGAVAVNPSPAAGSGSVGTSQGAATGVVAGQSATGAAGMATATTSPPITPVTPMASSSSKSGGCAVRAPGASASGLWGALLFGSVLGLLRRRKRG